MGDRRCDMKIVLFGLNGSYSHTCLALRCLRSALEGAGYSPTIIEATLKDRRDEVLQSLYLEGADVYGFSCYIWNISEMLSLACDLKSLLKDSKIIFGGPEVSFDTCRFEDSDFIDCIVRGEGEGIIADLCAKAERGEGLPKVVDAPMPATMKDEGILYRNGDYKAGEMLYYESSRGCPYNCSYCLSSAESGVRAKSVEQTLCDLLEFERLSEDIKVIKFVDRTFNCDRKRANAIWRALADGKYTKNYHFEICASLLDEESFEVLSRLPAGKVQLEIGLQSTNPQTLAEVSRHIDSAQVISATERLHKMGNMHIHLDLIAGLPYEGYESFKKSFNDAYFCCDMLQLGFLKLLHGTRLREKAEEYGIKYSKAPPYTVLETNHISRNELYRLSGIADLLDRFYSSGRFARCIDLAVKKALSPFDFYEGLNDFISENEGKGVRKLSQTDAYRVLYAYVRGFLDESDSARFEELMHMDFSEHEARRMPLSVLTNVKKEKR